MKKITFCCFIIFSCSVYSQISLTQSFNEPKGGDLESTFTLDTSAYASGLPLNVTGNNAVWNFTNLKALDPIIDNYYLSASSETSSASFPGCTFVQESGVAYSYFKSTTTPTTQTEIVGVKSSTMSLNFTNSGIVAKYPITFGSTSTDNMSGTFTFSVNGTCSGNITTTADGQGTLNLPGGYSLTNVLRVKSVQTLTLTALIIQLGVLKQTIYNYYHASQKFPVLSINYTYLSSALTSSPSLSGYATGSANYFITGLKENTLENSTISLYPNPSHTNFTIGLSNESILKEIKIYNQLGELVLNGAQASNIDVSGLTKGIYLVEIYTDKGVGRKKIIKE